MHHAALFCPIDHTGLIPLPDGTLSCGLGHVYPVVDGTPVLLRYDIEPTHDSARASIARAKNAPDSVDTRNPNLYLESLGVSEREKALAVHLAGQGAKMDPVVSVVVAATNGIAYKHLVGREFDYPIPDIRLPRAESKLLLDIGCSWGRWSVAATRKGYRVIGIDPSLSAVMAGKRVAEQLNLAIDYICADARHLPFENSSFDTVFSYSVIQHFSKVDAARTLEEIGRILKPSGNCLIQMPNRLGLRSLMHLCRRRFAEGSGFAVRYWSINELRRTFERRIGPSEISVHCYFGLGLEPSDMHLMPRGTQLAINLSERLRKLSAKASWMTNLADSVYVSSVK
jgi:SAM-dependent methyltransferase